MSTESKNDSSSCEKTIMVSGHTIHYEQVGIGDLHVFLMPGTLGFARMDFHMQLEQMNRDKFTIIAWDPPGYGHSRPPDRKFSMDFHQQDAKLAAEFLDAIGISRTSVIGWSGGGITAIILTALNPHLVEKLVVFGAGIYITKLEVKIFEALRDMNTWNPQQNANYVKFYGEAYVKSAWEGWLDAMKQIYEKREGNICRNELQLIKCPTLIIHGKKDPIVRQHQAIYAKENIKNAKYVEFEEGKHNLHQQLTEEFNKVVELFLTGDDFELSQ